MEPKSEERLTGFLAGNRRHPISGLARRQPAVKKPDGGFNVITATS